MTTPYQRSEIEWPVLIHCESGRKALLERYEDAYGRSCGLLTYWRRWLNIWVEIGGPLP